MIAETRPVELGDLLDDLNTEGWEAGPADCADLEAMADLIERIGLMRCHCGHACHAHFEHKGSRQRVWAICDDTWRLHAVEVGE